MTPSGVLPPPSLDPSNYLPEWGVTTVPPGLEAYDFGFGTTFLDMENDGDQDLYWLGSMGGRGEGPYGQQYEGVGRMMRSDGTGNFEDVTVESRLLDIAHVDYEDLDPTNPLFDPIDRRLSPEFHENGKGVAKGDLNGDGYVDLVGSNSMGPVWVGPNLLDLLGRPALCLAERRRGKRLGRAQVKGPDGNRRHGFERGRDWSAGSRLD